MHNTTLIMRRKTATESVAKKWMDSWLNKEALAFGQPLCPGDGSGQHGSLYGVGRVHSLHTGGRVTWWRCLTTGQKAPSGPSGEEESMRRLTADNAQNAADFSPSHLQNNRDIRECLYFYPALYMNIMDCSFLRNICWGLPKVQLQELFASWQIKSFFPPQRLVKSIVHVHFKFILSH